VKYFIKKLLKFENFQRKDFTVTSLIMWHLQHGSWHLWSHNLTVGQK